MTPWLAPQTAPLSALLRVSGPMSYEPCFAGQAPSSPGAREDSGVMLQPSGSVHRPGGIRIGTWNVSGWSLLRAGVVAEVIQADVLAVQETHLSAVLLEHSSAAARLRYGLHSHHGRPAPPSGTEVFGRRCGVGFIAAPGVALSPAPPRGPAWRMLHTLFRLHAVRLPPRPGLPIGLLLLSVYAPLMAGGHQVERERYCLALLQLTHELDMQTPTLLLGDFNGSVQPHRDFLSTSSHSRPCCPLLVQLLGPGGAGVDVQAALHDGPLAWTYRHLDQSGKESASRIDLVLANHAALPLVETIEVLSGVRYGGHSPVVVTLRHCTPWPSTGTGPGPVCPLSCGCPRPPSFSAPSGPTSFSAGRPPR